MYVENVSRQKYAFFFFFSPENETIVFLFCLFIWSYFEKIFTGPDTIEDNRSVFSLRAAFESLMQLTISKFNQISLDFGTLVPASRTKQKLYLEKVWSRGLTTNITIHHTQFHEIWYAVKLDCYGLISVSLNSCFLSQIYTHYVFFLALYSCQTFTEFTEGKKDIYNPFSFSFFFFPP